MTTMDFITGLVMHFPVRHDSEEREREWMRSLSDAIKHYDGDILRRAGQHIVDTRSDRRFPLPAEIRKACETIIADDRRRQLVPSPETARGATGTWTEDRKRLATELCFTNLGRVAARDGWVLSLWNFCRENSRLPNETERRKVIQTAAEFNEILEDCLRGHGGTLSKTCADAGTVMAARRDELAHRVLNQNR